MDCISNVYRDKMCNKIKETKYLVKDATDVSEHTQQATVFYYELESIVHDKLWRFFNPKS